MEKTVLFVDYANINRGASDLNQELDFGGIKDYLSEGRSLVNAHCYLPIDPRNEHQRDGLMEQLWLHGYIVTAKVGTRAGATYKCNLDVEMTMDILRVAFQMKPDIIVLASGDGDLVPLVQELRRMGIRVEVASFEHAASREMMVKASGFISLDYYLQELRTQVTEVSSQEVYATAELARGLEHSLTGEEVIAADR